MAYENKDNELRLFKNKYKKTDRHPDMTGNGTLNGEDVKVSAWANIDKSGNKWLKVSINKNDSDNGGVPY